MSSRLRITGGKWVRHRIDVPKQGVRPTTDRARESVFAILSDMLEQKTVLDLFAGSGALGLEALSRGASAVHFVESHGPNAAVLTKNIQALGATAQTKVHKMQAKTFLKKNPALRFDYIFVDPPYALSLESWWSEQFVSMLLPGGQIILERDAHEELPEHWLQHFKLMREKKFGTAHVRFLMSRDEH